MNSKVLVNKALSMCLVIATIAMYSMVALAGSDRIAGELLVSGQNSNGETPFVIVNGETAQSGRSIFTSSVITTPENTSAVLNLGKIGQVRLAPNSSLAINFSENGINGDLTSGQITVLNSSQAVNIKTFDNNIVKLDAGESTTANSTKVQDDDDDDASGSSLLVWALVLGGAAAGIIIAATSSNNDLDLGGGTTVVSPTR